MRRFFVVVARALRALVTAGVRAQDGSMILTEIVEYPSCSGHETLLSCAGILEAIGNRLPMLWCKQYTYLSFLFNKKLR